jgi:hypothetical protein
VVIWNVVLFVLTVSDGLPPVIDLVSVYSAVPEHVALS